MNETKFACPHCKHEYEDELEVLNQDELHEIKCEECAKPFYLLIKECSRCAADTNFVWTDKPTWEAVALLSCGSCGASFLQPDDLDEEDS